MAAYDFAAQRLFVEEPLAAGTQIVIEADRANYLLNVLRLRDGAAIIVFNGRDGEWRATLSQTTRRTTVLQISDRTRTQTAGPDIDYCFAPLKHARLDYVVQKAVEMGARRLQPVITRRTQVSRVNRERMRANAIEAAEQCGILSVPEVIPELPLERFLANRDPSRLLILCDEDAPRADPLVALGAAPPATQYALLIGPEGGFDPRERETLLAQSGVVRISLGPRILRADTAGVAAMALLQAVRGDLRAGDLQMSDLRTPDTMSPR